MDLFVTFPSKTNVWGSITNNGKSFESSSLTSLSLFLDWFNFHDLFFKLVCEEFINDFGFLDWDWESENVIDVSNFTVLNKSSELSDWFPCDLIFLSISGSSLISSSLFLSSPKSSGAFVIGLWCLLCVGINFGCVHGYKKMNII